MHKIFFVGLLQALMLPAMATVVTLKGELSVGNDGNLSYSLPLALPPGIGGMTPQLGLSYSSQAGASMLGAGWNVSGLSGIVRCGRTRQHDGLRATVELSRNDRFCLDGQRLVQVGSATYGASGSEYRLARDGYSKIIAYGDQGNGPQMFRVWNKSGLVMDYGLSADSRREAVPAPGSGVSDNQSIVSWGLSQVQDRYGNAYRINYDKTAEGGHYPASLVYNVNPIPFPDAAYRLPNEGNSSGKPEQTVVRFNYSSLSNPLTVYSLGNQSKLERMLQSIAISTRDTSGKLQTSQYLFNYSSVLPRRLVSLQYVPFGSTATAASPHTLRFDWGAGIPANSPSNFFTSARLAATLPSFAYPELDTKLVCQGEYCSYPPLPSRKAFGDIDGDGYLDLIQYKADDNQLLITKGVLRANTTERLWLGVIPTKISITDIDGDGWNDLLIQTNASIYRGLVYPMAYWIKNQNGSFPTDNQGVILNAILLAEFRITFPEFCNDSGCWTDRSIGFNEGFQLADFNGDGKPDLYASNGQVWRNTSATNGVSFILEPGSLSNSDSNSRMLFDFNGDNLTDLAQFSTTTGQLQVALAQNNPDGSIRFSGFSNWSVSLATSDTSQSVQFGDMNADGLVDLVLLRNSGVLIYLNLGTKFSDTPLTNVPNPFAGGNWSRNTRILADVNGDGLPDYVAFDRNGTTQSGIWYALNQSNSNISPSSLMQGIDNLATDLSYEAAAMLDFNYDGLADFFAFQGNRLWLSESTLDPRAGLLTRIIESTGVTTQIAYDSILRNPNLYSNENTPLNGSNFIDPNAGKLQPIAAPLYVVQQVTQTMPGVTLPLQQTDYIYHDLRFNRWAQENYGQGWAGFAKVRALERTTNTENISYLRQDWPYLGMPAKTESYINGHLVSSATNQYQTRTQGVSNGQPYSRLFIDLVSTDSTQFDYDGSFIARTLVRNSGYDEYGNIGNIATLNLSQSGNPDGVQKTVVNSYLPANTQHWILGRLSKAQVVHSAPQVLPDARLNPSDPQAGSQPTLTVRRSPLPLIIGQPYSVSWDSSNATSVSVNCNSGTVGSVRNGNLASVSGTASGTVEAAWLGNGSCVWNVVGNNGSLTYTENFSTYYQPEIWVTRSPAPLQSGAPYSVTWNSNYASTLNVVCNKAAVGNVSNGNLSLSGSASGTAVLAWDGAGSCVWTATGAGGSTTYTEILSTAVPKPTLNVTRETRTYDSEGPYSITTVTWNTTNATSLFATCFNGFLALSGSIVGQAPQYADCVWTATGPGGSATFMEYKPYSAWEGDGGG